MSQVWISTRITVSNSCGNTSKYFTTVTISQKLNKIKDPQMTFDTALVEVTCVTLLDMVTSGTR